MPATVPSRAIGRCGIAEAIVGAVIIFTTLLANGQRMIAPQNPQGKWEVLEGCTLSTNAHSDGDSFQVEHLGRAYRFRLYFVDAPEMNMPKSDSAMRQRIREQAAFFGISSSNVTLGGSLAAQFSLGKLRGHEFKVVTRWQPVAGPGGRFYSVLLAKGEDLAEALVANGLARVHGLRANWPDEPSSRTFLNKLRNLELAARGSQLGLWDEKAFPRITSDAGKAPAKAPGKTKSGTVNINEASLKELQTLPGIGTKLGERIIAHRPYQFADDLLKVPGIGTNILERVRQWVRTEP